jgi:predicted lipoprotein with Yx(FWY)xxD motif
MWTKHLRAAVAVTGLLLASACATQSEGSPQPQNSSQAEEQDRQQAPPDTYGDRSEEGGYWPASVQLGQNQALGQVVLDGRGFTLYRSDKDTTNPVKSTCEAECSREFPPVLANDRIQFQNLNPALIGTVARKDGTKQVTVGNRPVYRFSKDVVPGMFNGHGAKNSWFAIAPDGSKAGTQKSSSDTKKPGSS